MHTHGTAVLDRPAEAISLTVTGASARDQWLAKCESQLATALATRNANLLPEPAGFLPELERCPDCRGTGYDTETLDLCYCMAGERPAYDYHRYASGNVVSVIELGVAAPGMAEVWVPCTCGISPVKIGPYDGGDITRVPWVPDCPTCNDTGWKFSHHITSDPRMGLPRFLTVPASPDHTYPYPSQARSALHW